MNLTNDNCLIACASLLKELGVPFTMETLKDTILSHPDHPSLLSVADVLSKYNVSHLTVELEINRINEIPLPAIIQVLKGNISLFYVLKQVQETQVIYIDDKKNSIKDSKENFLQIWTGISLLVEKKENSKEPGIEQRLEAERPINFLKGILVSTFLIWILFSINNFGIVSIPLILFLILKVSGLIVSSFLLWFEIDQSNPMLQNFCSGGKYVNCSAVLNSRYANLFGSTVSLSSIAFAYFFGSLACLLILTFIGRSYGLIGLLSLLSLPMVVLSAYYQGFVLKNWCKFCLAIQAILLLEGALSLLFRLYNYEISYNDIFLFIGLFTLSIIAWSYLRPLLIRSNKSSWYIRSLARLKNNKVVFDSLLMDSEKVLTSPEGLGITLKNRNPKFQVIKVCNPYCNPCAKAHPILERLYEDGVIDLQIIFMVKPDGESTLAQPVMHFLAIDQLYDKNNGQSIMRNALGDWYNSKVRDYKSFSEKYPMNGKINQHLDKIESMDNWCTLENITHTPTIYINGFKLPKEYMVQDLPELLA